jgi:surface carbohydrate biosynthesis protein
MMKKINILLPIEIIARELDHKLFFAASLAKKGVNVIIAQHDFFNTRCSRFEGGVYIGKNTFKLPFLIRDGVPDTDFRHYNELKKNDITLIHLDEEAALWPGGEEEWRGELDVRLNPDVLKDTDYIFAWGSFQAKHFQNKSSLFPSSHIIASGHPKYDLCKPKFREYYKEEIDKIKAEYGSFILINTKSGHANPLMGLKSIFGGPSKGFLAYTENNAPQKIKADFVRSWAYENKVTTNIVSLLHELCVIFPNKTFVVRPHPGEDPEYYRSVFTGVENIYVEKSGAVHPWIMAANLIIHDGCTTGVESFLAGIPTISYQSLEDYEFDINLPNQCGVNCKTVDEVINAINDSDRDPESFAKKNTFSTSATSPKSLLKNFEFDTYNDFICMVDKIIENKRSKNTYSRGISIFKFRFGEVMNALEQFCRTLIRVFFPLKRLSYSAARVYFPGFDRRLIKGKIRSIERILNKKVVVNYLSSRLMVVTSTDDGK